MFILIPQQRNHKCRRGMLERKNTVIFRCHEKSCFWVQWLYNNLIISFSTISSPSIPLCPNMGNLVTQTFSMSFWVVPSQYVSFLKAMVREMGPYLTRDSNLSLNHISSPDICLVASFHIFHEKHKLLFMFWGLWPNQFITEYHPYRSMDQLPKTAAPIPHN